MKKLSEKPAVIFFLIAVLLTCASLLFSQPLGSYKKVSGWPLTMYEVEYERMMLLSEAGEFKDQVIEKGKVFKGEIAVVNIFIWTLLLSLSYHLYHKLFTPKKP